MVLIGDRLVLRLEAEAYGSNGASSQLELATGLLS